MISGNCTVGEYPGLWCSTGLFGPGVSGWVTQHSKPPLASSGGRLSVDSQMQSSTTVEDGAGFHHRRNICYQEAKIQTVDREHEGWVRSTAAPDFFFVHNYFLHIPQCLLLTRCLLSFIKYWPILSSLSLWPSNICSYFFFFCLPVCELLGLSLIPSLSSYLRLFCHSFSNAHFSTDIPLHHQALNKLFWYINLLTSGGQRQSRTLGTTGTTSCFHATPTHVRAECRQKDASLTSP